MNSSIKDTDPGSAGTERTDKVDEADKVAKPVINEQRDPFMDDDTFADVYLDKPINTNEYLKLLAYCVAGLIVIGLIIAIFFSLIS